MSEGHCKRAYTAGIGGLVHQTPFAGAIAIIKSGFLKSTKDITGDYEGQFIGVYVSPLRDTEPTPVTLYSGGKEVFFVFSVALLERADYHMNLTDANGYLTQQSYSPANLWAVLEQEWDLPEIVFHNPVSLEYLEKILVPQDQFMAFCSLLKQKLSNEQFDNVTGLVETFDGKTIPPRLFQLHCNRINRWKFKPRFCAAYPFSIKGMSLPHLQRMIPDKFTAGKLAVNCGFSEEEMRSHKTGGSLRKAMSERELYLSENPDKILKPAFLPPFHPI